MFDVDPRCAGNHGYFAEMEAELHDGGYAALLHDLQTFDLDRVNLRVIPKTEALLHQKERTLDPLRAWWLDKLESGATTRGAADWEAHVETQALHDDYIKFADEIGVKRRLDKQGFGTELRELVTGLGRGSSSAPTAAGATIISFQYCLSVSAPMG